MTENNTPQTKTSGSMNRPRTVLASALAVFAMLVLIAGCGGGDDTTSSEAPTTDAGLIAPQGPIEISPEALSALAQQQTIYWAGEMPDTKLELTVTNTGNLFVRYVPKDAEIGNRDEYLTVSTYPASPALELLQNEAQKTGAQTEELSGGGLALALDGVPTNAYMAFPGANYQVEVYDPKDGAALEMITSGDIEPVV